MKSFLTSSLFIALLGGASAAPFNYGSDPSGPSSTKCALINVAMDESGSMKLDQNFLKQKALPRIAKTLYKTPYGYSEVFLCSGGFGNSNKNLPDNNPNKYRHLGCTTIDSSGTIANSIVVDWNTAGRKEDGWVGMQRAMDDVYDTIEGKNLLSTCGRIDKNLILVTDEDRDDTNSTLTATDVQKNIADNQYILNVIANVKIDNQDENVGMKIGGAGRMNTIYKMDLSEPLKYTEYTNTDWYRDFTNGFKDTHIHYSDLVVDKPGALWSILAIRKGGALTRVFADVFVTIKVAEISRCPDPSRCEGGSGGDPHITTWHNEHYEYHGQCDLVMMKDPDFADGLGLDVHIRTKIVRYWSYIRNIAIKIDNDILEIEGSADADDAEAHYWYNFEYQSELETVGGFPVTEKLPSLYKRQYKIDLSSKFGPGTHITVKLYKEFVRVTFNGPEQVFGKTVGLLGDYTTGKTFARDGITVINDFVELGDEWQVLPSELKLFHEISQPQFPELCLKPEDPRGERKRRLDESSISLEQAEMACAGLRDPLSVKDCVYDILATQDLDMVGAF